MRRKPLVVLIAANYNGASLYYKSKPILWYCCNSLKNTNYENFKVVVTDDSSTDNSLDYLKKNFPEVSIIVNKPNGGYTKNINNGIKYALKKYNLDYVLLMNTDVIIKDSNWLKKLVDVGESDKSIGTVGCKYLYPDGRLQHAGIEDIIMVRPLGWNTNQAEKYNEIKEMPATGGVIFLIKKNTLHKVGLMDENYYMGSDDVDYCLSVRKAGLKVMYDGQVSVIHLEGFTSNAEAKKKKRNEDYWFPIFQVNRIYYAFKHFDLYYKVKMILIALATCIFSVENKEVKLSNIKLKNKILWRFKVTIEAIILSYKMHKHIITRDEAYGRFAENK